MHSNHFDILYTRLVLLNVGHTLSSNSTVQIYELLCDIVPFAYTLHYVRVVLSRLDLYRVSTHRSDRA